MQTLKDGDTLNIEVKRRGFHTEKNPSRNVEIKYLASVILHQNVPFYGISIRIMRHCSDF